MSFMLEKILLIFAVSNIYLGTEFNIPRSDLIVLNTGEEIECKVLTVNDAFVNAETKNGEITIIREININSARDIVETGLFKHKNYSGRITYFGDLYLEIDTSGGVVKIKKGLVRKIVISSEPSYDFGL